MRSPVFNFRSSSLTPSLTFNFNSKSTQLAVSSRRPSLSVKSKSGQEWILDPDQDGSKSQFQPPRRVTGGEDNKYLKRRIWNVEMRRNKWRLKRHLILSNGSICDEEWSCTTDSGFPPFATPPLPKTGSETLTETIKRIAIEESIKACWSFVFVLSLQLAFNCFAERYKGVVAVAIIVTVLRDRKWPWPQTDSHV